MRVLLFALIAVAAVCPVSSAQADVEIAKARAKAALDLAVRQRERDAIADAKCRALQSLDKICEKRDRIKAEHRDCMTDLPSAVAKATVEKLPLFVWVGMTCDDEVRKAFPKAVHVHVDEMNGATFPRLVIQSKGETWRFLKADLGKQIIEPIRQWLTPPAPKVLPTAFVWQTPAVCVT